MRLYLIRINFILKANIIFQINFYFKISFYYNFFFTLKFYLEFDSEFILPYKIILRLDYSDPGLFNKWRIVSVFSSPTLLARISLWRYESRIKFSTKANNVLSHFGKTHPDSQTALTRITSALYFLKFLAKQSRPFPEITYLRLR